MKISCPPIEASAQSSPLLWGVVTILHVCAKHRDLTNRCNQSIHWHELNAMIPCRSQEPPPILPIIHFFLPLLSANHSSILPHFIQPSGNKNEVNKIKKAVAFIKKCRRSVIQCTQSYKTSYYQFTYNKVQVFIYNCFFLET